MRTTTPFPLPALHCELRRPVLPAGLILGLLLSLPLAAQVAPRSDQPPAPGSEPIELQRFVTTGSNIKRMDSEKILPMTLLYDDAIELRQAFTPVEILTTLPQVTSVPLNETQLGSSGARGDNASVSLRNLNPGSTLVLINGRRLAANPMTPALNHSVNVNHLPTQGIAQIEVLRDGASSIYGSDAIGGVINYVLRRDFTGTETKFRYGYPENGGGRYLQGSLTFGRTFAGTRGRLLTNIDYMSREEIYLYERSFSASANNTDRAPPPFNNLGGAFDLTRTNGVWPIFRLLPSTTNNFFRPVNGVPTLTTVAPTRAANPEFYLDPNKEGMAQPRSNRLNWFNSVEYDLNSRVTVFGEVAYYQSKSLMERTPVPLNAPVTDQYVVMSVNNPYNPYGSRFYHPTGLANADGSARLTGAPRELTLVNGTVKDLETEKVRTQADVYRILAGARGTIGESWNWESALFRNQVKGRDIGQNNVRESLFQAAAARTDAGAYNPFGYTFRVAGGSVVADQPYTNPRETVESFVSDFTRFGKSTLTSIDARLTGRALRLWSGDLMVAFGAEYREETLDDERGAFGGLNPASSGLNPDDNDFVLHPPRPDVFGDRTISSFYGEAILPLIAPNNEIPLFHSLEATASARYEDYNDFGDTTKPKVGLTWKPVNSVMFRGSINRGFIAPSLSALYTSARWTAGTGGGSVDNYRNPVLNEGPYVTRNYFGGNPGLKASDSEGKSFGLVVEVPFVRGLTLSADYWEINQTDIVSQRSSGQVRDSDIVLLNAFTQSELARGVPINQIDPGSGTASYKGDPDIVRFAPTAQDIAGFAAYNAANPGAPRAVVGRIFADNTFFVNLAEAFVSGWDFRVNYMLPATPIGRFTVNSDWAYLLESSSTLLLPNRDPILTNNRGANGASRWRGTSTLNWRRDRWSAGLSAYYIGSSVTGTSTTQANYESLGQPRYIRPFNTGSTTAYRFVLDSVWTFNANLGYRFGPEANALLRNTTVRLGVTNLADKAPPLSNGQFGYNADVHGTMIVGRSWTLDLTRRF